MTFLANFAKNARVAVFFCRKLEQISKDKMVNFPSKQKLPKCSKVAFFWPEKFQIFNRKGQKLTKNVQNLPVFMFLPKKY